MNELTKVGWHAHDLIGVILDAHKTREHAPIISVLNVSKFYGSLKALDRVDLHVPRGSITALLGPNGAGKTTLIRILTTLTPPSDGTATVDGLDVVRDAGRVRAMIGLAGQHASVDEVLTGRENLTLIGKLYHLNTRHAQARADELIAQFGLEDAAQRMVKTYSSGMRRRLDLAASIVNQPKILYLDEPTVGLDPHGRMMLWNSIRDLVASGTTVLLTTQYLEEADQMAHRIFVMDHGRIIAQGTSEELKRRVGGDILELHVTDHRHAARAAKIIERFGSSTPQANTATGVVTMPVGGGAALLPNVIRECDDARIHISDIMLRRPSLDDVFMKLTGHAAE